MSYNESKTQVRKNLFNKIQIISKSNQKKSNKYPYSKMTPVKIKVASSQSLATYHWFVSIYLAHVTIHMHAHPKYTHPITTHIFTYIHTKTFHNYFVLSKPQDLSNKNNFCCCYRYFGPSFWRWIPLPLYSSLFFQSSFSSMAKELWNLQTDHVQKMFPKGEGLPPSKPPSNFLFRYPIGLQVRIFLSVSSTSLMLSMGFFFF